MVHDTGGSCSVGARPRRYRLTLSPSTRSRELCSTVTATAPIPGLLQETEWKRRAEYIPFFFTIHPPLDAHRHARLELFYSDLKGDSPVKLSVVVPVFNECASLQAILEQVRSAPVAPMELEIVAVDDCSTDGSREILKSEAQRGDLKVIFHEVNQGKGASVRTGLRAVTGDIVLIQDADLEYDPADYPILLKPILAGKTKVVYGSRFLGEHKAMYFWHSLGNRFLTLVTNVLFDTTLTDMETCYKVFTSEVAACIELKSPRWGFDPEITARILRHGFRIYEVPISYAGREYQEGKKITWKDGLVVLFTLLRYRFLS